MESATKKLDAVHRKIEPFVQTKPAGVTIDVQPDGWRVARFRAKTHPPRQWGLEVGEIVNAFRSALDYLVYTLAEEAGGNPGDLRARTQWPIFTQRDEYPKHRERMLKDVPDRARTVIDWLQPFDNPGDLLAQLDRLTDDHKHRKILPSLTLAQPAVLMAATPVERPITDYEIQLARVGTLLVQDAEIGRIRLRVRPTEQMDVQVDVRPVVAFGTGHFPFPSLGHIGSNIGFILSQFERFDPPPA